METLTPPKPACFPCCSCGNSIDVLYPWLGRGKLTPFEASALVCPACWTSRTGDAERPALEADYGRHRWIREQIGMPAASTLLVERVRGDDGKPWASGFRAYAYWAVTPNWDANLPQEAIRLSGGSPPFALVLVAFLVAADQVPGTQALFRAAWPHPDQQYRLEILGWSDPQAKLSDLKELMNAMQFFREFRRAMSGPKGARVLTLEEFTEQVSAKYWRWFDQYGERPSLLQLGDSVFYVSEATISRIKSKYMAAGGKWPPPRP